MEENPNIPHQEFDYQEASKTVGASVFEALAGQVSSGNIGGLAEMLSGKDTGSDNPIVSSLTGTVVENLSKQNGINPALASTIASVAIPFILNMFNKQAGTAQAGGMDMGSLISGALAGGNQGGGGMLGNLLGGILGGNNNQGGGSLGANVIGSVLGQLMK